MSKILRHQRSQSTYKACTLDAPLVFPLETMHCVLRLKKLDLLNTMDYVRKVELTSFAAACNDSVSAGASVYSLISSCEETNK
jgi:hypothetical protein